MFIIRDHHSIQIHGCPTKKPKPPAFLRISLSDFTSLNFTNIWPLSMYVFPPQIILYVRFSCFSFSSCRSFFRSARFANFSRNSRHLLFNAKSSSMSARISFSTCNIGHFTNDKWDPTAAQLVVIACKLWHVSSKRQAGEACEPVFCWFQFCSHVCLHFGRLSHESLIFTILHFQFWGISRTNTSFSDLQFWLIQETSEACHVLRLLAAHLRQATWAKKNIFSQQMGQRLADRDYVIFWVIVSLSFGLLLGTPGRNKKIGKTMILGNPSFENS